MVSVIRQPIGYLATQAQNGLGHLYVLVTRIAEYTEQVFRSLFFAPIPNLTLSGRAVQIDGETFEDDTAGRASTVMAGSRNQSVLELTTDGTPETPTARLAQRSQLLQKLEPPRGAVAEAVEQAEGDDEVSLTPDSQDPHLLNTAVSPLTPSTSDGAPGQPLARKFAWEGPGKQRIQATVSSQVKGLDSPLARQSLSENCAVAAMDTCLFNEQNISQLEGVLRYRIANSREKCRGWHVAQVEHSCKPSSTFLTREQVGTLFADWLLAVFRGLEEEVKQKGGKDPYSAALFTKGSGKTCEHFTVLLKDGIFWASELQMFPKAHQIGIEDCVLSVSKTSDAKFLADWLVYGRYPLSRSISPQAESLSVVKMSCDISAMERSFCLVDTEGQ